MIVEIAYTISKESVTMTDKRSKAGRDDADSKQRLTDSLPAENHYKISEKMLLEIITCMGNPIPYKYTTDGGRENMRKLARKTMTELIEKGIFVRL